MPGLVGIIGSQGKEKNKQDLLVMLSSMQHEVFYSSGTYLNEAVGVYLGWACHQDSYCDSMPVVNESKTRLLFFYGEHHSGHDEISALTAQGRLERRGGVRSLLDLYEENRSEFFKFINGWFHGVIVDLREREIHLFNDRYGVQRLYYYEDGDTLLFSAEAKAILKVRKELRQLDPQSVGEYLACDCVLENRCLFKRLYILPGGSLWTSKGGRPWRKGFYFEPKEWEEQTLLSETVLYERLKDQLPLIMARYLGGSEPIGVSLSAGLDSRLIMASMDNRHQNISCYSFDGMYRESFDAKLARRVAAVCNKSHTTLVLDKDFLTSFPSLAERTVYLSDGCLSAGGAYELYLNKLARKVASVRVTGSYGSEVFRGLRAFKPVPPIENFIHQDLQVHVTNAINTYETISKCHNLSFSVFRQAPWHGYGRMSVEQSQVVLRTPYMDNDLIALLYCAPESVRSSSRLQWNLIEHRNPALVTIPTDRGLHARSGPFSRRWAYLWSYFPIKAEYWYKSGMPNWLEQVHYLLGPFQPQNLIVGRHRFYHNRIWFRNELAPYLKDILLDPMTLRRPFVNGTVLETMLFRHVKGDRNYTAELEKALTIELIYRLFIDS